MRISPGLKPSLENVTFTGLKPGASTLRGSLRGSDAIVGMAILLLLMAFGVAEAQTFQGCACGKNPPGRPAERSMKPYAQEPEDMQPFSKFTQPYYQHYVDLVEYNGAARDIPVVKASDLSEVARLHYRDIARRPVEGE